MLLLKVLLIFVLFSCTPVWDLPLVGWVLSGACGRTWWVFIYARPAFTSQYWAVTVIVPNVHDMLSPEPWDFWPFIYLERWDSVPFLSPLFLSLRHSAHSFSSFIDRD